MDAVPMLIARVFQGFTLVKIGVAVAMVVGLSVLAERVSTRFAGVVSGFPLGAAIVLFFIGYEISPAFAGRSAVYTVFGLIGTLAFVLGYYGATIALGGRAGPAAALGSALGGLVLYFAAAGLLQLFEIGPAAAVLCTGAVIVGVTVLFRRLRNVRIDRPLRLGPWTLILRACFAAGIITLITASARLLGPDWAGLLSVFPMTMLPFLFIIHATYRTEHVRSIIKNVPRGLGAIVVYGMVVAVVYPRHGVWLGTLEAYLAATFYLSVMLMPLGRRS